MKRLSVSVTFCLIFGAVLSSSAAAQTSALAGEVIAKRDGQLQVEFDPNLDVAPAVGDLVDFKTLLSGHDVAAGVGKVTEV